MSKSLLEYTLKVLGEDRIMLATDYPYENLNQSMQFIREAGLSDQVLHKVCYRNAETLGILLPKLIST